MVKLTAPTLPGRLEEIERAHHCNAHRLAVWAGVSDQAMSKWKAGGGHKDANLRMLARNAGVDFYELRDGPRVERRSDTKGGDVDRKRALRIYDLLPAEKRAQWLEHGEALLHMQGAKRPPAGLKSIQGDKQ